MSKTVKLITIPAFLILVSLWLLPLAALADYCDEYEFGDFCYRLDDFDSLPSGYQRDPENPATGEIFYGYCKVRCADAETFEAITLEDREQTYGKDKNHVFYMMNRLQGIDPETFKTERIDNAILIYDEDTFYLNETVFKNPPDLETLETDNFLHDKYHVYARRPIEGIPEDSFLPDDLKHQYIAIEGADPEYFTSGYNITDDAVYWYGKKIEGADPESFERMKCDYSGETAKDKDNVFWKGEIAYGIDVKSFASLASNCFDKNGIYDDNDNLKRDRTLDSLKEAYKDNNQDSGMVNDSIKSALLEYKEKYPGYTPQPAIDPENPPKHPTLDRIRDIITDYKYLNPPLYYAILIGPFLVLFALIGFVIWKKR